MDLKIIAIYECFFSTSCIPAIDCFLIGKDAPLFNEIHINKLLAGKFDDDVKQLSDFIKKYTQIE